ncbi:MAG: hypothetical protein ABUL62_15150 [Myxococcales bacterium]
MSISRHLPLLACAQVLVMSCASHPELARPRSAAAEAPRWNLASESPALHAPEPRANKPYAPTRLASSAVYVWQTEKPAECSTRMQPADRDAERPPAMLAGRDLLAMIPERTAAAPSAARSVSPELVVAGLRPALHHCFSRWQDEALDAQGSARFALELGCAGEVEAISAENRGVDEGTLACLFSAMGPAHFAPPAAGHATVLVPVMFKNAR